MDANSPSYQKISFPFSSPLPLEEITFSLLPPWDYSFLFNTSHVVLGDMPDFFQKHVWITRHAIPFTQRPG